MGSVAPRCGLRLYVNFNDAATIETTCDPPLPTQPAAPVENLCRFYFNKPRIKLGMRRRTLVRLEVKYFLPAKKSVALVENRAQMFDLTR